MQYFILRRYANAKFAIIIAEHNLRKICKKRSRKKRSKLHREVVMETSVDKHRIYDSKVNKKEISLQRSCQSRAKRTLRIGIVLHFSGLERLRVRARIPLALFCGKPRVEERKKEVSLP